MRDAAEFDPLAFHDLLDRQEASRSVVRNAVDAHIRAGTELTDLLARLSTDDERATLAGRAIQHDRIDLLLPASRDVAFMSAVEPTDARSIGRWLDAGGHAGSARWWLQKAVLRAPVDLAAYVDLGEALLRRDGRDAAREIVLRAEALVTNDQRLEARRARLLWDCYRPQMALRAYARAFAGAARQGLRHRLWLAPDQGAAFRRSTRSR